MQQRVAKAWSKLGYNPIPGYVVDISTELSLFFDNDDNVDSRGHQQEGSRRTTMIERRR
jgi:hypothetical protein